MYPLSIFLIFMYIVLLINSKNDFYQYKNSLIHFHIELNYLIKITIPPTIYILFEIDCLFLHKLLSNDFYL